MRQSLLSPKVCGCGRRHSLPRRLQSDIIFSMGQILIRNLPDDLIADYREAASRNQRSMEAEVREALRVMRPKSAKKIAELIERSRQIRAMTSPNVNQTPSEQLVREIRDGNYD